MKLIQLKLTLLLALLGGFLLIVGPAHSYTWVPYDGAWYSTDGNFNFYSITFDTGLSDNFYLLDESKNNSLQVLPTPNNSGKTVYITKVNTTWYASLNEGGTDLDLGTTGYFWFKYGNITTYEYLAIDPGHQYLLKFSEGSTVVATISGTDIAPVPLPSSALLIGSGLLGLIGFGLRRRPSGVS